MKKAVHFGAGKIGRGFIAELLHDSGFEIVFGDVVDALVDIVNKDHEYPLFLIDHDYQEKIIDHVIAYSNIKEPEKIIDAICEAEVITTSVMATNLPKIAPLLTQGLKKRLEQGGSKVTVMACENAIMGTDILKKAMIETGILTAEQIDLIHHVYRITGIGIAVNTGFRPDRKQEQEEQQEQQNHSILFHCRRLLSFERKPGCLLSRIHYSAAAVRYR